MCTLPQWFRAQSSVTSLSEWRSWPLSPHTPWAAPLHCVFVSIPLCVMNAWVPMMERKLTELHMQGVLKDQ